MRSLFGIAIGVLLLTTNVGAQEKSITVFDLERVVLANQRTRLVGYHSLEPNCSAAGKVTIRIAKEPTNGKVEVLAGPSFPNYDKQNDRHKCNDNPVDSALVYYTSQPDFKGSDSVALEVFFPYGTYRKGTIKIEVK